jgi:peptidoglycan/LPS O-acetylase OafA/YrhL
MTVLPMIGGLALAALPAAGRRRTVLRSAQIVGASAALAATAQTFTAGFDTPSTIALSLMHVVIAVLVALALEALARRQRAERAGPVRGA